MRLVRDVARPAVLNMAIDEMLMSQPPCLRLYTWSKPSLSIGYFQSVEETVRLYQCEKKSLPVVRRLTGGGLVRHGQDVTFCLTLSEDNVYLPGNAKESYLKVAEVLRRAFQTCCPGLDYSRCSESVSVTKQQTERVCFEQPVCHDLLWQGKKVMGASQRRSHGAILHQSSLFFKDEVPAVMGKVIQGFREFWGVDFEERPLDAAELRGAQAIAQERYGSREWAFDA